jgi:cell wall-associated NlpC family hydrolase
MKINKKDYQRRWLVKTAEKYWGTAYIYGGDDHFIGLDCSGLVMECLKTIGMMRETDDYNADSLWQMFSKKYLVSHVPDMGRIFFLFDNNGRAYHTGICMDEYMTIQAGGGSAEVDTKEEAIQKNAFVKYRPAENYPDSTRYVDVFVEDKGV